MESECIRPEGIIGVAEDFEERIGKAKHEFCENRKETAYPEIARIREEMHDVGEMIYKTVSIILSDTGEPGRVPLSKRYEAALEYWERVVGEAERLAIEVSLSGRYGSKMIIEPEGSACFRYEGIE